VLDGCDGELARVRFQQTASGEWLDTLTDDALNLALVAGLGLALRNPARGGPPGGPILAAATAAMLLFYNVVAYRELRRQGEGGEVLKVRWWFARGRDMKALAGHTKRGPTAFIYNLGRRDVFVLVWLLQAGAAGQLVGELPRHGARQIDADLVHGAQDLGMDPRPRLRSCRDRARLGRVGEPPEPGGRHLGAARVVDAGEHVRPHDFTAIG